VATAKRSIMLVRPDDDSRATIAGLLQRRGYRVQQAASGEEALALARKERPSLALLDVRLPDMSGYDVCREFRGTFGDSVPIVFLSGVRTEPYDRVVGLRLGADDYIVEPFAPEVLLARVDRLVEQAAIYIEPSVRADGVSRLSVRESEVLRLLADGRMQKEIARDLSISPKTVSNHIQNILVKLGVNSQAQAVAAAFSHGVAEIPERRATHARRR
jgi:DNA-binding NarL/FixJ family response regulator